MEIALVEPDSERLDARPAARSIPIEDLLRELASGKIRIPPFQRPLRWQDDDRVQLLDSIYRGFPVGTFLFWQREAEAQALRIGRLEIDASARSDAFWVVDGQQRLVTLADTLLAEPLGKVLHFDLEEKRFAYGTNTKLAPPRWLPVAELSTTSRLLHWARLHLDSQPEFLDTAFDLGKRLREYQIPAYVVEANDEAVVRQIFDRVNSTGKPLSGAEVFDALHTGKPYGKSGSRATSLRDISESLRDIGFGPLEAEDVLLALLAVRGKDPARGYRQIRREDASEALQETERALRRVLGFLRESARIPHRALLPYQQPLTPLALFFHRHPEPNARCLTLLTRWLWRGSILGAFRGDTLALRRMLSAIVPEDPDRSAHNLLLEVSGTKPATLSIRPFNLGHARSKLQLTALAAREPRLFIQESDPENAKPDDTVLDLATLCEQRGGPAVRLVPPGDTVEADGLAARILHPPRSWRVLHELISMADDRTLKSHLISGAARDALGRADVVEFLMLRGADLQLYVEDFFQEMAAWNPADRDRPSLDSLVLADEE